MSQSDGKKLTPMMAQYLEAKKSIPSDAVLLFRLGDFYEEFFEDAETVSSVLELTLTKRQGMPMCGFPYHALDNYLPKLVAAGLKVAIAEQVVQHDMDTSPIGDPVGLISGINIIYIPSDPAVTNALAAAVAAEGVPYERGTVASGDQFICRSDVKAQIKSNFETADKPVIACEMEGAAIGQVCYVNGTPYGILRAISDGGDEQAFADYPTFLAAAAKTATEVMLRFVETWG